MIPDLGIRPAATGEHRRFWDAVQEGRLEVQACDDCDALRFPPAEICPTCRSFATRWQEIRPAGAIHTWTTVTHPVHDLVADQVPYLVALVDLDDGVRMALRLVVAAAGSTARPAVGMPVEVCFPTHGDGFVVPVACPRPTTDRSAPEMGEPPA